MIYTLKRGLCSDVVMLEGRRVARITRSKNGVCMEADGKTLFIREEEPLQLDIYPDKQDGAAAARCRIILEETDSFVRPPRAAVCRVQAGEGMMCIRQHAGRSYTVQLGGAESASIEDMTCMRPRLCAVRALSPGMAAVVFALCMRMEKEDELTVL